MECNWQYGEKPWIFEEGFIKQRGTDVVLGTIGQSNRVTLQTLEADNPSQKWRKENINWDDGDEKDYQLVHEESGKFLTARELSLTVENKGRVTFIFTFKTFCYKSNEVQMLKASNVENNNL